MHVESDTASAPLTVQQSQSSDVALQNSSVELRVIARSDMGRRRKNNEDSFVVFDLSRGVAHEDGATVEVELEPRGFLLAVADGMGGHQSGEVASRTAVETLSRELMHALNGQPTDMNDARTALAECVLRTNKAIFELSAQKAEYAGMGTTLTAALVKGTQVMIAQVGDSRTYLIRDKNLTQLTRDQTVKNQMLEIQPDAVISETLGSMLAQALGTEPEVKVVVTDAELEQDDVLVLCSDGLTKTVPNEAVAEIASHEGTLKAKAETLITLANNAGGPDNVTVVLSTLRKKNCGVRF